MGTSNPHFFKLPVCRKFLVFLALVETENDTELNDLRRSHLANLKRISSSLPVIGLREHFSILHNSLDWNQTCQLEREKAKNIRINQHAINEAQKKAKSFEIEWNLEYCSSCKLSYWPANCRAFIAPKFGIRRASTRLFSRHKLRGFTPRYKSFKDKLLKAIMGRSFELIYRCKRCWTRNVLVRELNHAPPKLIPDKKQGKKRFVPAVVVKKSTQSDSARPRERKFKSLQAKLKHSEMQQAMVSNQKKNSFGSLSDFLQKLS